MDEKGTIITCDRCGAQAFGEIVAESGVGVPKWPDGWRSKESTIIRAFVDLCPKCAEEYAEMTRKWWEEVGERRRFGSC